MKIFKEILRWLAIPMSFFLAKPAASILLWFQSWYASPDSFYMTKVSPVISYFLTGYFLIYFVYKLAPRGKVIVISIYFGMLITLVLFSYLIVGTLDFETIITMAGTLVGLIQSINESKENKPINYYEADL